MRRALGPLAALIACAAVLAACSAGSSTGSTTSSTAAPASTSSTTSSTLAAAAVSVVREPVLVARTSDGSVGYREAGGGPPLVMIMGYSGSMDAWEPSFVDALGRAHRVVIFDNAGIGRTSALPSPLTVTAMANQTAALIATLRLGRPDVLGWSMGGMIAQALAVLHPSDVRRLVLCATYPGNGEVTLPSASAASALGHPSKANASTLLSLLFPANQRASLDRSLGQITSFPGFYSASAAATTAEFGALASWLGGKEAAGHRIDEIGVPTLIADGTSDELVPVANDRELARVIPHATLTLYPDAGHAFLFQEGQAFLQVVDRFLGD